MLDKLKSIGDSSKPNHMGFTIGPRQRAKCKSMHKMIMAAGRDGYVTHGDADNQRTVRDTDVASRVPEVNIKSAAMTRAVKQPTPPGYWDNANRPTFKKNHPDIIRPEDVGSKLAESAPAEDAPAAEEAAPPAEEAAPPAKDAPAAEEAALAAEDLRKMLPQADKAPCLKNAEQLKKDAGMVPRPTRFFLNPAEQENVADRYFLALKFQSQGRQYQKKGEDLDLIQTCIAVVQPVMISMIALTESQIKDPERASTVGFVVNMVVSFDEAKSTSSCPSPHLPGAIVLGPSLFRFAPAACLTSLRLFDDADRIVQ